MKGLRHRHGNLDPDFSVRLQGGHEPQREADVGEPPPNILICICIYTHVSILAQPLMLDIFHILQYTAMRNFTIRGVGDLNIRAVYGKGIETEVGYHQVRTLARSHHCLGPLLNGDNHLNSIAECSIEKSCNLG